MKYELGEMFLIMTKKDGEIAPLDAQLDKVYKKGPGSEEISTLRTQNEQLNAKVKELKDKLLKIHEEVVAHLYFML